MERKIKMSVKVIDKNGFENEVLKSERAAVVDFCRTYSQTGNQIVMQKECVIHHRRVPRSEIPAWNKIISDWGAACNEQVVLKEK